MKKLFEEFNVPNILTWKELIAKELKSDAKLDPTAHENTIEELDFNEIYNHSDYELYDSKKTTNDWQIGSYIEVIHSKEANAKALELLNLGANSLNFDIQETENLNLSDLMEGIGFQYIHLYFTIKASEQEQYIQDWFTDKSPLFLQINNSSNYINGFDFNTIGANASQEVAYALAKGKKIIERGDTNTLHFTFGIGSNFLIEIAKFRAFRFLWDKISTAYKTFPKNLVTAQTGFINKSLNDPYTNLLRQTTEGLSAVLGGVDQLIIQPYDALSINGSTSFTERMAINISLILKEESEVNQIVDPFSGSYIIENYTETICNAAWSIFQEIEKLGGIETETSQSFLHKEVERIRQKRLSEVSSKKQVLVGINNYQNPDNSNLNWKEEVGNFLGLENLIIEKDLSKSDKF